MFVTFAPILPIGNHSQVSSLSSVQTLTIPNKATGVYVQALTQNVRFVYWNGTQNPTSTVGFQIKAGDPAVLIPATEGQQLKFIEETASAVLQYQFARSLDGGA